MQGRVHDWDSVAFDFWMPDRRYPEFNPLSLLSFRPKERGRPPAPPDAYVVEVRQMQPVKLNEPGYVSPERGFRNLTSISAISSYSFENQKFGLVRFWQHDWPYPQPEPFTRYRQPEGSDPQVLLHCTPPDRTSGTPLCSGTVHFAASDLGFFVVFPREVVSQWRDITQAADELFKSWKVQP